MKTTKKNLSYYQLLPYRREVDRATGEGEWKKYFVARIIDIPDCFTVGKSRSEALFNLDIAFDDYVSSCLEDGDSIPAPTTKKMPITSTLPTKQETVERSVNQILEATYKLFARSDFANTIEKEKFIKPKPPRRVYDATPALEFHPTAVAN